MKPIAAALYARGGFLLMGMLPLGGAEALPPPTAQVEISFLLGFVDGSACQFYRNGSWYAASAAQAHLRDKYLAMAARDLIASAEEFIEKAATKSSLTGEAYAVHCPGTEITASGPWLRAELARLRNL
jgi:hypothetical protein